MKKIKSVYSACLVYLVCLVFSAGLAYGADQRPLIMSGGKIKEIPATDTLTIPNVKIGGLTALRLVAADASKNLIATLLGAWIVGTTNQITVTADGNGGVILSLPQNLHIGATPTLGGLTLTGFSGILKATAGVLSGSASTSDLTEGTNLYYTDALARASLSSTATGLTYTFGTGVFSLTAGYVMPTTTEETNWNTAYSSRVASWSLPLVFSGNALNVGGLSSLGTSNFIVGVNSSGTGWEYKSLAGTADQIVVTHSQGGVTLSLPQSIGTGSSLAFYDLTLSGGTASRIVAFDSNKKLVNTLLSSWIFGTTNQIIVTADGAGGATISTPQNLHSGATPTFGGLTLSNLTLYRIPYTGGSGFTDTANFVWDSANNRLVTTGLKITTGAANSYVWTSDVDGVGSWQPAPSGTLPGGAIGNMLYHNGTSWVPATGLYFDGTNLGIGGTPNQKADIFNGNLRFTQVTAPGAPSGALAGIGAGNLSAGNYYYKVTFITALGETEAGTASSVVTVSNPATNGQVSLSAIPTGTSDLVTQRKIYRTAVGGSVYKLLTTIANNTDTSYVDNVADGSLTTQAPESNTTSGAIYAGAVKAGSVDQLGNSALTGQITMSRDSGVTLTTADFGKTVTINSGTTQIAALPSVTASNIGSRITIAKLGAGQVTVTAAGSSVISDSAAGGSIYNNQATETWANIVLQLVSATQWMIVGGVGTWITL